MKFYSKRRKWPLYFILVLSFIGSTITVDGIDRHWRIIFPIAALFIIGLLKIEIEIEMNDDQVVYRVTFLNRVLYQRAIHVSEIKRIKCMRVGWATRRAVIYMMDDSRIKLTRFEPSSLYEKLINMAGRNHIEVLETKDFQILMRGYAKNSRSLS
ncbi:hypothetical protein D9X91_14315 [Falsibacillus albus]|uniref:PH domain-containing protein n=2 Tax=Falsibacillus albus TaxID=2478915 RepID=A0A3L7JU35_9BACI|nr:hypothetical protein D9X91_14315 [Falsibacillus albus]